VPPEPRLPAPLKLVSSRSPFSCRQVGGLYYGRLRISD
jgi:hypothetical protein